MPRIDLLAASIATSIGYKEVTRPQCPLIHSDRLRVAVQLCGGKALRIAAASVKVCLRGPAPLGKETCAVSKRCVSPSPPSLWRTTTRNYISL